MATYELDLAETYIYRRLSVDPDLQGFWLDRLYNGAPPQGADRPYGLITLSAAGDDLAGNNVRTAARVLYLVRSVFAGEDIHGGALAAGRIDDLLDRTTGTVPGGSVLMCRRQGSFSLVEFPQGLRINHRGGFYELLVQATPVPN